MDVEKVVREYIDKTVHMSLATVSGNRPWVCEVHFAYDDELNLYFRSLRARRHSQEIADNLHVAGNIIDKYPVGVSVVGVYFEGLAKEITDEQQYEKIYPLFYDRLGVDESAIEDAKNPEGHKFYKISVTDRHIFGRFGGESGQKYSMKWKVAKT